MQALSITGPAAPDRAVQLRKAATEFEAVAIGELLAPMFETADTAHGLFGGGEAEATWRPMMVQAIGRQMAAHGGLGLADSIYSALMRAQENGK
ncbi:MAG TPA: rod-binding protein [Acetobacteraceae bacterium]